MCTLDVSAIKKKEVQCRMLCLDDVLRQLQSGQEEFINRVSTPDETRLHY